MPKDVNVESYGSESHCASPNDPNRMNGKDAEEDQLKRDERISAIEEPIKRRRS